MELMPGTFTHTRNSLWCMKVRTLTTEENKLLEKVKHFTIIKREYLKKVFTPNLDKKLGTVNI